MNSQFKIHWFALFAGILSGFGGGLIAGKCYSFGSFIIGMIFSYIIGFSYSKYCELRAKRRNKALPDNIRLVFDRWTGNSEHGRPTVQQENNFNQLMGVGVNKKPIINDLPAIFRSKSDTRFDCEAWMISHAPWNRLDAKIISKINDNLYGTSFFESFIRISEMRCLVDDFVKLNRLVNTDLEFAINPKMAEMLYKAGKADYERAKNGDLGQQLNLDVLTIKMSAIAELEASICFFKDFIPPYIHLSILYAMINLEDMSKLYCSNGLAVVHDLKSSGLPQAQIKELLLFEATLQDIWVKLNTATGC